MIVTCAPIPTAIFAANDHLAIGLLRALHERSRRVPEEVSIVGFDDVPEAGYLIPPLTTIRPDFHAVADRALRLLLSQRRPADRTGSCCRKHASVRSSHERAGERMTAEARPARPRAGTSTSHEVHRPSVNAPLGTSLSSS